MVQQLTQSQLQDLETTERVASCFSLAGTLLILVAFLTSPAFRKPVNRIMFYASIGNILCNIATLISRAGPRAGSLSHLCQFQAFMIQLFTPADALWNLALAINVYLTLFKRYSAEQLRALEWKYHLVCYGCPFIVAIIYLLVDTKEKGHMYGDATLWCWIGTNWVTLRVVTCYAPAWVCIVAASVIYIKAGREIFSKRRQLRAFNQPTRPVVVPVENPFTSYKTTEVKITSEAMGPPATPEKQIESFESTPDSKRPASTVQFDRYTVTINSSPQSTSLSPRSPTRNEAQQRIQYQRCTAAMEANAAAWSYCKCAMLFFVSLLVTWVRASLLSVLHHVLTITIIGPFLNEPSLLSRAPRPCLPSIQLRLRHCPSSHGLLELRHILHYVLGSREDGFRSRKESECLESAITTTEA